MYLGNLTQKESGISGTYTYMRRGTNILSFPDLYKEISISDSGGHITFEEGNLFNKGVVGWKWLTVLDIGIDIAINLDKPCYIDRIKINQGEGSAVKSVKIFCSDENAGFGCKGRLDAATGGELTDNLLEVTLGVYAKDIIIRLDACFKDIVIEGIDIIGAVFDDYLIYPVPASISVDNSRTIPISRIKTIIIGGDTSDDTVFAANLLKDKFYENYKMKLPVLNLKAGTLNSDGEILNSDVGTLEANENDKAINGNSITNNSITDNAIILGKLNECKLLDTEIQENPSSEGYIIKVYDKGVFIKGADRRGLIYGVESLLMLIKDKKLPVCEINDYPFMEFRGVHFGLPPREEIPFVKRLIRYVFAPMKMNTIFLEFAGGMRYDRHPKINEIWEEGNKKAKAGIWPPFPHGTMVSGGSVLEKHEVADLVDYARSYGFEVIPEVQSLSHVQYITAAYPEVAETEEEVKNVADIDLKKEDMPPSKFYKDSYCPSNEKSYKIVFDLIDEIIEVVRPTRFVHMGHDEVYTMGTCPLCKGKDHADLYASDVNKIYNYLAGKNLKMMIWADMLQDVTNYETPPAIDKIPKDIILLDFIWYFHTDKDIEDHLLKHGFKVIMGNMYSSHYPRFENRARKKGILGAQVSTWKRMDEYNMGFEGKIYDFIYSANMMWSASYRSDLRLTFDHMISKIMPRIRSQIHGVEYPSLSETKKCFKIEFPCTQRDGSVPGELGPLYEIFGKPLAVLPKAAGSITDDIPESVTIPVDDAYDSLIFLHTASRNVERIPWQNPIQIGSYIVEYDDGSEIEIPIEYGANIGVWSMRYAEPLKHSYYRHQGYISTYFADPVQSKTKNGRDITLYSYEWINPYKNKTILSVTLAAKGNTDSSVMLFGLTGVMK